MNEYKVLKSHSKKALEWDINSWSGLGYELVCITPIEGPFDGTAYLATMKKEKK